MGDSAPLIQNTYLLRALASCGKCGLACGAQAKERYKYYICAGKKKRLRTVDKLRDLDSLLHLGHENPNRRIAPQEAARGYAQSWRVGEESFLPSSLLQDKLEAVARVADWLPEFCIEFARVIDRELEIEDKTQRARRDARDKLGE